MVAPRKKSQAPTRIWKFCARTETPDVVHHILRLCNRYYNKLVEIERERSNRFREARRRFSPELGRLEDEWMALDESVEALYREAKKSRQDYWRETKGDKRRLLPPEFEARKEALDAQKKVVSEQAKELREQFKALLEPGRTELAKRTKELVAGRGPRTVGELKPGVIEAMLHEPQWSEAWKEITRSDEVAHRAVLDARGVCGLHDGTYLGVETAFNQAKKDRSPRPPGFKSFSGNGKVQFQIRDHHTWATLPSKSLRIETLVKPPTHTNPRKSMICVTMDQTRKGGPPHIVVFTAMLHRQVPPDAVVKWVALVVRKRGLRSEYEFQLTLEHDSFSLPKRPAGTAPPDHVRIGWIRNPNGIRVAYVADEEIVCPTRLLNRASYAESIDAFRDRLGNEAVSRMRHAARISGLQITKSVWRRMTEDRGRVFLRRCAREWAEMVLGDVRPIWKAWRIDRLSRKEDLYASLRELRLIKSNMSRREVYAFWCLIWANKDEHLFTLTGNLRRRFEHQRDNHYRTQAIRLSTRFSSLTIDDFSIAELKKLEPLTMPGTGVRDAAQWQLHASAPGRFREILIDVMGPRCVLSKRPDGGEGGDGVGKPVGARTKKTKKIQSVAEIETKVDAAE